MIEPTETESKAELDRLIEAICKVAEECYSSPELVKGAPHSTSVTRINEAKASHPETMCLSWKIKNNKDMNSKER
jgi:glycine dehydrogenase subunit 2